MKRLIITGTRGYISNKTKNYFLSKGGFDTVLLDLRDPGWENASFDGVDCIIHASALVHKKEKHYTADDYNDVNTVLTQKLAEKAKKNGVPHFVFISTAAVYGIQPSLFKNIVAGKETPCRPLSKYGISKYNAELALKKLCGDTFTLTVVRPPMVYGKGCPGNYNSLRILALRIGVFPKIENQKSMIYIDNLCEFLYRICEQKPGGVFVPQNPSYVKTYELASLIAKYNGKRLTCTRVLIPFVKLASLFLAPLRKAFGSECYRYELSGIDELGCRLCDLSESVRDTEK